MDGLYVESATTEETGNQPPRGGRPSTSFASRLGDDRFAFPSSGLMTRYLNLRQLIKSVNIRSPVAGKHKQAELQTEKQTGSDAGRQLPMGRHQH